MNSNSEFTSASQEGDAQSQHEKTALPEPLADRSAGPREKRLMDAEMEAFVEEESLAEGRREAFFRDFQRSPREIANRMLCLIACAARSQGALSKAELDEFVALHGIKKDFTPFERGFLYGTEPSPRVATAMTWRVEPASVLLWSLGFGERLPPASELCDPGQVWSAIRSQPPERWDHPLPEGWKAQMLDERERAYQDNWKARDARINGREPPEGIIPGVAQERHHAFNWLLGERDFLSEDGWEDTPTST